jgi:hypothetical protein
MVYFAITITDLLVLLKASDLLTCSCIINSARHPAPCENLANITYNQLGKKKEKLSLCHEDIWGNGGIARPFVIGTR